jgi:prepilin-type N-terminal cleavage/methylation domain-containing protein/prepilin-type processing-associated H-X9-DG protein
MHTRRSGFTLTELMVALSIVALMGGLLLDGVTMARDRGSSQACSSQLRNLGQAALMYAADYGDLAGGPNWIADLTRLTSEPRILLCPSDPGADPYRSVATADQPVVYTSYGLNIYAFASRAPSRTVLLCDAQKSCIDLTPDSEWNYQRVVNDHIGMRHRQGINAVFMDGHVERLDMLLPRLMYNR